MIKISLKIFIITSQPFIVSESTTTYLFESYWVVLSTYQKLMVPLSFIFCWRKHIFLIIIHIFAEKHFSSNFKTADPLNMIDPSIFSFLRDLHTDNTLVGNKYTKNIRWGWMMPHEVFFLKSIKNCWGHQKYQIKGVQTDNIWKQQHNSFPTGGLFIQIGQVVQKLEPFKGCNIKKLMSAINFSHYLENRQARKFYEIVRKCIKLIFRRWKVGAGFGRA